MIVPDINLLLYAYDSDSPFHRKAAAWWQGCLSGTEPVGLAQIVVFGFVRIGTNGRVFRNPMTSLEAVEQPRADHVAQVLKLLETLGTAGNLVTDAQLAALALEHGAVLHTADADFLRFRGLRWFNPITGAASRGLPRSKRV